MQRGKLSTPLERLAVTQHSHKLFKEYLDGSNLFEEEKQIIVDDQISIPLVCELSPEESSLQFVRRIGIPYGTHMHDRRLQTAVELYLHSGGISPLNWIQQLASPTTLFIDVGANLGIYTALALAWGYKHSLCIEPHPRNFKIYFSYQNTTKD